MPRMSSETTSRGPTFTGVLTFTSFNDCESEAYHGAAEHGPDAKTGVQQAPPMTEIDDATVAYVLENRTYFEDLRQAIAQLAGLLVLIATGGGSAARRHPLLDMADQLVQGAIDGLGRARVPIDARPHHDVLLQSAAAVRRAVDAARRGLARSPRMVDVDPVLVPLRAGYAHLHRAGLALPGCDMIAFDQGCCGGHRLRAAFQGPAFAGSSSETRTGR
jgi:hypothetical protein